MKSLSWAVVLLVALAAGCGGGAPKDLPNLVPVTGTLTQDGQPLAGAVVAFQPETGSASSGLTDANGRFELQYSANHKGAVLGVHTIRISKMEGEAGNELIPPSFNTESTLTETVSEPGPNDFNIEI